MSVPARNEHFVSALADSGVQERAICVLYSVSASNGTRSTVSRFLSVFQCTRS